MSWYGGRLTRCFAERRRGRSRLTATVLATCLLVGASPAMSQRLVLLPPQDQGEAPDAIPMVMPLVESEVIARGWEVVSGESVERQLIDARIRRMDSLPSGAREMLLDELDAQGYIATTIFSFRLGKVPVVTIGLSLVDLSGAETFSEVIGLSTEDTRGPLDPFPGDAIEPLVDRVIKQLFRGFPIAGKTARQKGPTGSPIKLHKPFTFLSSHLDAIDRPHRVAVLPFRSFVRDRSGARIAAQLTARWLERAPGFEPVDPADLRAALVAERVRDASAIWPETIWAISQRLGSKLFLRGTVYRWQEEASAGSEVRTPAVEVNLTLIDASTSRVVWSSQHGRRGDQYSGFMRLGSITNVVALADRVIGEMFAAQTAVRPVSMPPPRAHNAPINGALKALIHGPLEKGNDAP